LISIENPTARAKRIYTSVLGLLLYAKVHNDLGVLDELESSIMDMVGAGKATA